MEPLILAREADSVRPPRPAPEPWRQALREAIRSPEELARTLELPSEWCDSLVDQASNFPLLVPRSYVARMRQGDVSDPLLRQVLPLATECEPEAGFTADPVGDAAAATGRGLLQKYQGRALLVVSGACAVHCRYCFRRHYPYAEASLSRIAIDDLADQLSADKSISEVILSGGDPLSLGDVALGKLCDSLAEIPHITRLRIHTRWPIVIPERVTDGLLALLLDAHVKWVVVLHVNHANELTRDVPPAIERLRSTGALLLNQAVLLRGVNDSVEDQRRLSERLVELSVIPYYLHQLDHVAGAAHFEVPIDEGKRIIESLRSELPGYMVPRYVQEIAGAPYKVVLAPSATAQS